VRQEGLGKLKNVIYLIGNETRDLPDCSRVRQPTTLSRKVRKSRSDIILLCTVRALLRTSELYLQIWKIVLLKQAILTQRPTVWDPQSRVHFLSDTNFRQDNSIFHFACPRTFSPEESKSLWKSGLSLSIVVG
jgi:hypothetical protein